MKRLLIVLTILILTNAGAFAQNAQISPVVPAPPSPPVPPALYITQYQLIEDKSPVYGVFDLGNKPSVKFIVTSPQGGKLTMILHGRYYHTAVDHAFSIHASYEDVTGRVFQDSDKIVFDSAKQSSSSLKWFTALENVAGLYGNQTVTLQIPAGTSVINVMADDETTAVSPNQLMGYISHVKVP